MLLAVILAYNRHIDIANKTKVYLFTMFVKF